MDDKEEVCCPEFDPKLWDKKVTTWHDRKFIKAKVFTFFYIPVNFGPVILKLLKAAKEQKVKFPGNICLSDHTSYWNMDIYISVDREMRGYENIRMSGDFLTKVYEGDFKNTGKWCEDFEKYARSSHKEIKKMYMWYTTCPGCAKKYGRNYVVIAGKVA